MRHRGIFNMFPTFLQVSLGSRDLLKLAGEWSAECFHLNDLWVFSG